METLSSSFALRPSHFLVTVLVLLLTGCDTCKQFSLTYRLWDTGDFMSFNEPAAEPKLELFAATNGADVLVVYDAVSEKRSSVKRKAYYIWASRPLNFQEKPRFVSARRSQGMVAVPILAADVAATNAIAPPDPPYAVKGLDSRSFTLYPQGGGSRMVVLPYYQESSGTAMRIVFTPLAVGGDLALIGGVAAFVFAEGLAQSQYSFAVR